MYYLGANLILLIFPLLTIYGAIETLKVQIVGRFAHDTYAFTQGLAMGEGLLYGARLIWSIDFAHF